MWISQARIVDKVPVAVDNSKSIGNYRGVGWARTMPTLNNVNDINDL